VPFIKTLRSSQSATRSSVALSCKAEAEQTKLAGGIENEIAKPHDHITAIRTLSAKRALRTRFAKKERENSSRSRKNTTVTRLNQKTTNSEDVGYREVPRGQKGFSG